MIRRSSKSVTGYRNRRFTLAVVGGCGPFDAVFLWAALENYRLGLGKAPKSCTEAVFAVLAFAHPRAAVRRGRTRLQIVEARFWPMAENRNSGGGITIPQAWSLLLTNAACPRVVAVRLVCRFSRRPPGGRFSPSASFMLLAATLCRTTDGPRLIGPRTTSANQRVLKVTHDWHTY